MASNLRRYWDSACCFGFLADQEGRRAACERVLDDAKAGGCEIVISGITIAEVLHLPGQGRTFPRRSRDLIRDFFKQSLFVFADVDRFIAERAADMYWDHGIGAKDALHVATALASEAHYLETFDGPLIGKSRQLGGDPQLVIQEPGADLIAKALAEHEKRARLHAPLLTGLLTDPQGPYSE